MPCCIGAEACSRRIDPTLVPLGSLLPSRIVHDIEKALTAFKVVYDDGGAQCPWLANQNSHRRDQRPLGSNWGGKRVRKAAEELVEEMEKRWENVDAAVKAVMSAGIEEVKMKCRKKIENLPEGDLVQEEDEVLE